MPAIPAMGSVWQYWGIAEADIINGADPVATWQKLPPTCRRRSASYDETLRVGCRASGPGQLTFDGKSEQNDHTIDDDVSSETPPPPRSGSAGREHRRRGIRRHEDAALKLLLLGIVDAIAVYAVFVPRPQGSGSSPPSWRRRRGRQLDLLLAQEAPGEVPDAGHHLPHLFQVFVLVYTGYIAFTNYGTGHNGSKEQAVSSLMASSLERVEDSPTYPVTVVDQLGTLGLLVTDPDGEALVGTNDQPLTEVDAQFETARPSPSTAGRRSSSPTCSRAPTRSPSSRAVLRRPERRRHPHARRLQRLPVRRRSSTTRPPAP